MIAITIDSHFLIGVLIIKRNANTQKAESWMHEKD